jgi:hypothetical protein
MTKPVEVQCPDIEAGFAQRVAPRFSVKSMSDRKRGRERRTMQIEHRAPRLRVAVLRRQEAEEKRQSFARAWNAKKLLSRVEFCCGRKIRHAKS